MCLGHFPPHCVSGIPVFSPVIGCVVVLRCIVPPLSLSDQSFDGLVDPWYMLLSADGLLRYVFVCSLFGGIFQERPVVLDIVLWLDVFQSAGQCFVDV